MPPSAPKYQQTPGNSMSPMQGNVVLVDVVLVVEVVVLVDSVVLVLLLVDVVVLVVVVGGNALAMVIAQLSTSDWELAPSQLPARPNATTSLVTVLARHAARLPGFESSFAKQDS